MAILKHTAIDHPEANGRQPLAGERGWTLSIPLENGDDYLEIRLGKRGRDAILDMLKQENTELGRVAKR